MAGFPNDRFDDIPEDLVRVGAHRTPPRRGRGWVMFAWAALATGILVVGGLYGLSRFDPSIDFALPVFDGGEEPGPSSSPTPSATPVTDPSTVPPELGLSLSVFNGTPTDGLQDAVADQLAAAGWPDPVRANAVDRDETVTTIYYWSTDFEGIALGLRELLGVGNPVLSDAFPGAPVTIVLGTDYAPPA